MEINYHRLFFLSLLITCLFFCNQCASLHESDAFKKKKEEVELKKSRFLALQDEIISGSLKKGADMISIKEKFGKPDSIFRSGSGTSVLEIWTYERILEDNQKITDDIETPIKLYFESARLISWNL